MAWQFKGFRLCLMEVQDFHIIAFIAGQKDEGSEISLDTSCHNNVIKVVYIGATEGCPEFLVYFSMHTD